MCGRYFIGTLPDDPLSQKGLAAACRRAKQRQLKINFEGEISPGDIVPSICNDLQRVPDGFPLQWGMAFGQTGSRLIINARSETAQARPAFAEATRLHRCLLPASRYFEWAPDRTRYAFWPLGDKAWYLAGLYRLPQKGDPMPRFAVLTRDASPEAARIHDRMPVLFTGDGARVWLDLSIPYPLALLQGTSNVQCEAWGGGLPVCDARC